MNQSFYTGAVGAQQHLRHLNVVSNNIANINTYGFKAERAQFSALMYQNMRAVEDPVLAGVGGRVQMTSTNFHPGGVADTGRSMDYMIEGDGFFALVDLGTGEVKQGLLEMSNTDLTQEFIKVIESQRAFSYALKMVITSDEIESTFNSLRG